MRTRVAAFSTWSVAGTGGGSTLNEFRYIFGHMSTTSLRTRIWLVTDGTPPTSLLGAFSSEDGARRYLKDLIDRYSLGKTLSVRGRQLARDVDSWRLGLGPTIIDRPVDEFDCLPGAWMVKVDESCAMIACEFSTQLEPTRHSKIYRVGLHHVAQAHATTPHGALDAARRAMAAYLSRASRRGGL